MSSCTTTATFFDARAIVIAVNPRHIGCTSRCSFPAAHGKRSGELRFRQTVPAVGATLDLKAAPGVFRGLRQQAVRRDLHAHFMVNKLANIPVAPPALPPPTIRS